MSLRPLRALLVEDSPDDAALVELQLRRGGFEPSTRRVQTAAEMEAALSEPWDVVLSDYSMPTFTGLEAFRLLRRHDPDVPFILISGTVGEDVAVAAMKAGIQDYLMKGNLERLVPAVERELVEAEGRRAGRHAAQALRESEERYRTLIETSPDAILLVDADHTVHLANRRAAKLFGGEAAGRSLLDLVSADQRTALAARLAAVPRDGPSAVFDAMLHPPSGRPFAAELSVSRAEEATAHGIVLVVRDATDRHRADLVREAQLAVTRVLADSVSLADAAERLLPSIADVFGWELGALYLVDEVENVLRRTAVWTAPAALGAAEVVESSYTPGQGLAGRVWSSGSVLFLPELRSPSGSLVLEKARGTGLKRGIGFPVHAGTEVIGVAEFLARDMETPHETFLAMLGQLGSQIGAFVARRRAEDAQRQSETKTRELADQLDREQRFLRALLDTLVEGIVACDEEGRLTLLNRATREFYAMPEEPRTLEGWSESAELFASSGNTPLPSEEVPLHLAFRGELVQDRELVVKSKGLPARTLVANARPIIDEAGHKLGAVVAMHDVTERRRLEEQFRQAQKMEALGSLAGGVAHDFNNLLTTILGYTEVLMMRNNETALLDDLAEVKKAAERASALTQKLLAFSRKQIVEARVLDLNAVVADLDKILVRLLGGNIRLESRLGTGARNVKADPGQLEQVLLNLVVNARDAMPRGGRIVVETSEALVTSAEAQAHVGARAGPHVVLSVSDEGIGIPPELLPRIFEPFFTTKEEGKGTGLGLATVFGIVAQAGGHIRVSSEPGKGTRFVVYLPRASESPSRRMSTSVLKVPGGSETVLVVDDQDAVRTLATRVLQFNGYVVLAAGSAEEALELAAKNERVDLLLTDALMPGLSGPELAHRLREKRPGIRVLLMSGYADPKVVSAGQQEGSAFLAKPFTARELADRVRRVLDEEPAGG